MSTHASNRAARLAICTAYLFPVILCAAAILLFSLPRFYFTYAGDTHEAMGLFTLVSNTWQTCQAAFDAQNVGPNALIFAYVMRFFVIFFWICLVWFILLALHSLFCPMVAFANNPISTTSNRAKKLFAFAWFNHPCYVIFHLIPFAISFFPQILLANYDNYLGMDMEITYFGIPDPLIIAILTIASLAFFFFTLSHQQTLHLDMFRLYKRKPAESNSLPKA